MTAVRVRVKAIVRAKVTVMRRRKVQENKKAHLLKKKVPPKKRRRASWMPLRSSKRTAPSIQSMRL